MVSILGTGILQQFSKIFTFLFIFVVVFGVLESTHPFGKGKEGLNALIALCLSVLAIISGDVVNFIEAMAPWFVVAFIVLVILMAGLKFFSGGDQDFAEMFGQQGVKWTVIIIFGVIILFSFTYTYGSGISPGEEEGNASEYEEDVKKTIFHPSVLGLIAILFISVFAIRLLAGKAKA